MNKKITKAKTIASLSSLKEKLIHSQGVPLSTIVDIVRTKNKKEVKTILKNFTTL